ncbi:hypothetical protein A2U01_0029918, partial [Trifolium medium]|nr:hypothetical protein [Trifolium medium]
SGLIPAPRAAFFPDPCATRSPCCATRNSFPFFPGCRATRRHVCATRRRLQVL